MRDAGHSPLWRNDYDYIDVIIRKNELTGQARVRRAMIAPVEQIGLVHFGGWKQGIPFSVKLHMAGRAGAVAATKRVQLVNAGITAQLQHRHSGSSGYSRRLSVALNEPNHTAPCEYHRVSMS
jgi:hypothetical protein